MNLRFSGSSTDGSPRAQVSEILRRNDVCDQVPSHFVCGILKDDLPKNSPAVGRPISVMSNNNFLANFRPLLIW